MGELVENPKVSVTVVTYNHGHWLAECLESIVTQKTDFPFEIIVGDDASTDGLTQNILRDYASRYPNLIVPVFQDQNIGPTPNYFAVLNQTRGEYIAHIDGDDRMLPGKLQKQVEFLDRHPECAFVAHEVYVFDSDTGLVIGNGSLRLSGQSNIPEITDINYLVKYGCFFTSSSKMYRRATNLTWNADRELIDFFFHIEQASQGKIGFIQEVLGEYRNTTSQSMTNVHGPYFEGVFKSVLDALKRAVELGVESSIAFSFEAKERYYVATAYLLAGILDKPIEMPRYLIRYVSLKYWIVWTLSKLPGGTFLLSKFGNLWLRAKGIK